MLVSLLALFAYFLALPSLLLFFNLYMYCFFTLVTATFFYIHDIVCVQRPVAYTKKRMYCIASKYMDLSVFIREKLATNTRKILKNIILKN